MTRGLALTGRVITAAAAIMVTVFASFMLGDERIIKLFGLGLASAVLIDAVIIRSILVPAIMQLLRQARLVAARLARPILPKLAVEPAEGDPDARPASTLSFSPTSSFALPAQLRKLRSRPGADSMLPAQLATRDDRRCRSSASKARPRSLKKIVSR